jgi:hypothetical protein
MMIAVKNWVKVYEKRGHAIEAPEKIEICVKSHWNREKFIEIITENCAYTVSADDLIAAINNSTNTAKF